MNFGEKIKGIRENAGLTQEQFAAKLNVTRQAISNWENNKNLPDIEMLILISDAFGISLDELIRGGSQSNNMTKKIIDDGSENKRAKYNMVSSIVGGALILIGIGLLVIKGLSVEYVDSAGILHENFFLIPIGFLCMFCGLITFLAMGIRAAFNKIKGKFKH